MAGGAIRETGKLLEAKKNFLRAFLNLFFFFFKATKVSEDLHTIGNLHVTKVSAELKMARSLVRVADIQATLQEQRYGQRFVQYEFISYPNCYRFLWKSRILFLRQQMKELEELKPPNHFMSD